MSTRPLIKDSLQMLNIIGAHPYNLNTNSVVRFILSEIVMIGICLELLLNMLHQWRGLDYVNEIAALISIYQAAFKISHLMVQRKIIKSILTKMETFWFVENEISEDAYKNLKIYGALISFVVMVAYLMFYVRPFFTPNKIVLPVATYHPVNLNNTVHYGLMYCFQLCFVLTGSPAVFGFDLLFVALLVNIIWELRSLKHKLSNINDDSKQNLENLYKLIEHHNLILKCIKEMDRTYHLAILNTFVANMFCICIGLLGIITSGFPPNLQVLSKYGLYVIFYIAQLYFYCFTGSYLITECAEVSQSVYGTDWWIKTQKELRRSYVMIIQRSNKLERLTAGGMLTLDLQNFTSIVRMALSFFTLVHASYKEIK